MTSNKILQLNLNESQTQNLLQLQQQLGEKLEQIGSLRPEMLKDLTEEMKKALESQAGFADIAAQARNRQTRLHLTHNAPNILNLPWRLATQHLPLLFLTKGKNRSTANLPILEADHPPLKILVMISSPENTSYDMRLNYEEEEDQIMRAFAPLFDIGQVQIDFTDDGSLDNLKEKIAANRYHIVHFSGHGIYHKDQQKGYLLLEDSLTMNQELVEAGKFAEVFQQELQNMPTLVVLSSCQTAKGGTEEGMKSVADELLLKGLPAVISMSVSVTDYFATYFASALYQHLAKKEPLFQAFQRAIEATQQQEAQLIPNLPPSQWMIPQLFVSQHIEQPVDFSKADQNLRYSAWKFVSGKEGLQSQKRSNYQFVGRRRDRKHIFQSWAKQKAILLKGQGGVGKTAMAEYLLQRLVAQDARIHAFIFNEYTANLSNIIAELERFLKSRKLRKVVLKLRKEHKDNAYERFENLFAEVEELCQPLFIFDNLESFQASPGAAFRAEYADNLSKIIDFCYTEEIPLILTCRYSIAECPNIPTFDLNQVARNDFLKKSLQLSLQSLPRKIAQQGLAHLLGEQKLTFREVVTWLHETFGGNYRALEFFDEVFAQKKHKLPQALQTLADFKQQYATETLETRQRISKNLLFEELLKLLDDKEKTALRLLCRFRIPVLVTALQMQNSNLDYASILDNLQELTLLEQHQNVEQPVLQFYYVTPLVKDLVKGAFEREGDIDFSVEMAGRYHKYVFDNIKDYVADLEEAFSFFVEAKNGERLNEIGRVLCEFYYATAQFRLVWKVGLETYQINENKTNWNILNRIGQVLQIVGEIEKSLFFTELSLQKATSDKNLKNQATALNNISQIHSAKGDYNRTLEYLKKSLAISERTGYKELEGRTLSNISLLYSTRGDYDTALNYLEQSLAVSQIIGDKKGEGVILNNISQVHHAKGDYKSSLEYLKNALTISQQIDDKHTEVKILTNISSIYSAWSEYDVAFQYLKQSLAVNKQIGDKQIEGTILNNISSIFQIRGDYGSSLKYFEQSLSISRKIGDKQSEGRTLNNIGQLYSAKGDYDTALNYLRKSLDISQQIGDKKVETKNLNNISEIFKIRGDYDSALQYLKQALHLSRQIEDKQGESIVLGNIGKIYLAKEDYKKSLNYFEQTLTIQKKIGDKKGICVTLGNIGNLYSNKGNNKKTLEYFEKSLFISQQIGDKQIEGTLLNNISLIFKARGDYDTTLKYLKKVLTISKELGNKTMIGGTLNNISRIFQERGDYVNALQYLEQSLAIMKQINDVNGLAITLTNMGVLKYELREYQVAFLMLSEAFEIFNDIGSSKRKKPKSYIKIITEKVGEEKVKEWLKESF